MRPRPSDRAASRSAAPPAVAGRMLRHRGGERAAPIHPSPFRDPRRRDEAGRLAMGLLFASLAVLFAVAIIGVLIVRLAPGGDRWGGLGVPPALLVSTVVLAASTVVLEGAVGRLVSGRQRSFRRWLRAAWWLGAGFVVAQGWAWWRLDPSLPSASSMTIMSSTPRSAGAASEAIGATLLPAAWILVVLTGLHMLHVAGGLVALGVSVRHADAGRYTASSWPGLRFARAYWHFLAVVWLALLATLAVVLR